MEAPDVWVFENLGNIVVDEAIRQGVGVWQDRKERENYDCQDSWFSAMAAIEEAPPSYKLAHDGTVISRLFASQDTSSLR